MTKFGDPIQRWRHSKTCKQIIASNPNLEIQSKDGYVVPIAAASMSDGCIIVSNVAATPPVQEDPEALNIQFNQVETEGKYGIAKKVKKQNIELSDFQCRICKVDFISLDAMKEHVRQGCSKPTLKANAANIATHIIPSAHDFYSTLHNVGQTIDDMKQSDLAEAMVANQIESLLQAAQVLQQQQQQQQANEELLKMKAVIEEQLQHQEEV